MITASIRISRGNKSYASRLVSVTPGETTRWINSPLTHRDSGPFQIEIANRQAFLFARNSAAKILRWVISFGDDETKWRFMGYTVDGRPIARGKKRPTYVISVQPTRALM